MLSVLFQGLENIQDYKEIIKVLYPSEDIVFDLNSDEIANRLTISVKREEDKVEVYLYREDKLLFCKTEKISAVDVGIDLDSKRLNVAIKRAIYLLEERENAPWGILTGIRPTKIVHRFMEEKRPYESCVDILKNQYLLSDEKIDLLMNIGDLQKEYIYPLDDERYSIYVGIPFCPTKCHYCSFPSVEVSKYEDYLEKYVSLLKTELSETLGQLKDLKINTVYIGGGTPTALPKYLMEDLILHIYKLLGRENIRELTVEAGRPDTLDYDYLKLLKGLDVDRISINPQTMNDETLVKIGRKHNSLEIEKIYEQACELNFNSINMDLILGLPGEDIHMVKKTLRKIKEMNPDNLTIHTLAIKRGSNLKDNSQLQDGVVEDHIDIMLKEVESFCKDMEYIPYYLYRQKQILGNYENVGYARERKECIYNISMMEEKETILGFGVGAVSKIYSSLDDTITRVPNFKSIYEYENRLGELVDKKILRIREFKGVL